MGNVSKQKEKRMEYLANNGLDTGDGGMIVEVRPRGSDSNNDWQIMAALKAEPKISGGIKYSDIETGFETKNMAKIFKGRKPVIDLSLMCLQPEAIKFAFGSSAYSLVEPDTPVSSTVDDTTTPTYIQVKVDSITGFEVGQRVAIMTGGTDNPQYELKHIDAINTVSKLIRFAQPLNRLPVDGATVKVIKTEKIVVGDDQAVDVEIRLIRNLKDGSENILTAKHVTLAKDGIPEGGMDGPAVSNISLEVLPNFDIVAGDLITDYFTFEREYQTTFS